MEPYKLTHFQLRDFNNGLINLFGVDTVSGQAMYRVVWSDDQFEKRLTDHSDGGILLLRPEVRLLPKYKQWIQQRYILEHLVAVPMINEHELPTAKVSYEIIWNFEDKDGNFLPPNLEACKFIINTMQAAMARHKEGRNALVKYVDDEYSQEASLDAKEKRIAEITEYLFGEQSALGGTTKTGETIIVPRTFEKTV
jgi:hypothetical protein